MLMVYTGCWGDRYAPEYVRRLERAVARNLTQPHRLTCVTDCRTDLPGYTWKIDNLFPGWWGKLQVLELPGPALWLDLDTVITGPLDPLCDTGGTIRTALNWARSGHGGCQSSVMYWRDASSILQQFNRSGGFQRWAAWPPRHDPPRTLWGDQEFITLLRDQDKISVDYFAPGEVVSYKYHCRDGLAEPRPSVVVFHGKPDPHEVGDDWVRQCWA